MLTELVEWDDGNPAFRQSSFTDTICECKTRIHRTHDDGCSWLRASIRLTMTGLLRDTH